MKHPMRILVTGANGQLGRHMQLAAAEQTADCYLFADRAALDVTDREAVLRYVAGEQVDIIVNCTAYNDTERAEQEEAAAFRVNAEAVGYLAEAAKQQGALLIHISTDFVFMGGCCSVLTEQSYPQPINAYGRSKLAGEEAIRQSGCHYIILRTAWLYSEFGRNFVKTILQLSDERETLRVVQDQVGSPTYAGDLAAAIVRLIRERRFSEGIYHYTNLGECSRWEFAVEICRLAGRTTHIEPCSSEEYPSQVQRPKRVILDKGLFQTTFAQEIPHWRESLERMLTK